MAERKSLNEMLAALPESSARASLTKLFDEDCFNAEMGQFVSSDGAAASVITGYGYIDGVAVYAFAQDIDVNGGGINKCAAKKIVNLYNMAVKNGSPVIGIYNSKGGEIAEGAELLAAYSDIIEASAKLSGVVPQISVVTGVCGGIAATLCCMADFVIMAKDAELFLTPPFIAEDGKLDGAGTAANAARSGVASIVTDDADAAIEKARILTATLPRNNLDVGGSSTAEKNVSEITADIKGIELITTVADLNSVVEINADFGTAAVTAFGSIDWTTIGFVTTNKADAKMTGDDAAKIARFVNICDAFSIPVVTFIDTDGFEPSSAAELAGSIRDSAKLAQVYGSATTPKISVITGNAIGASFVALGALNNVSDMALAYEDAVISPVAPKAAAVFLGECTAAEEAEWIKNYKDNEASVYAAMAAGYVDRVIKAEALRMELAIALELTSHKRVQTPSRKHLNLVF